MSTLTDTGKAETRQENHSRQTGSYIRLVFKWAGRLLLAFFVLSILSVISLRWINPPRTSFMIQRQIEAAWNGEDNFELRYNWVDWEHISDYAKVAAVTSEDQRFATHWGIDLQEVKKAIRESKRGEDLRGASTITQQTAKNLYLWPGQNYFRKGIEAYFAVLIDFFWPKKRILEMYLNIAEFGYGIYGVEAASHRYFGTSAAHLSMSQSALLVTALPSPRRYNLANPSGYMLRRRDWNIRYMRYLGGRSYLKQLE